MEWPDLWNKLTDYATPIAASVPGFAALFYRRRGERSKELTSLEVANRDADLRTRQMLSAEQAAWFDRMRTENADLRLQVAKAEAEADDAWKQVRRLDAEIGARAKADQPPFNM